MYLTPVKMIGNEDQQKEPDSSSCAFLGQEPDSAMKVEEEGMACHTENQLPPTVAILDLGCTRAMGSGNAINAFCDYVDKRDCGLWYKIEPTSSRFFLANSQQTKCTERFQWMQPLPEGGPRHGVCTLLSLALWKKEMFHY